MKISVVAPFYNLKDYVRMTLDSVRAAATGEWLAFLDGDDVWLENALAGSRTHCSDLRMVRSDAVATPRSAGARSCFWYNMAVKSYDFAVSLGPFCATSQALRRAGLQFCSCPFDWIASPDIVASAEMIAADFAHWLDAADLRLVDVRHGPGFFTRVYRNVRTGFGFGHEFSDFETFEASYPKVRAMYDRRIARLLERMAASPRILGVFTELPVRPRASDADLQRARRLLMGRFPGHEIGILYFYEEPACMSPRIVSSQDGVTVVAADYQELDHGEVTHFMRFEVLADFLHAHVSVSDYRTEEERRRFADEMNHLSDGRWGVGLRKRINRLAYALYRHVERTLQDRGVVYRERPMWYLWPELQWERKEAAHAGV